MAVNLLNTTYILTFTVVELGCLLTILQGQLESVREILEGKDEDLEIVYQAHSRMENLINVVLTLAGYGRLTLSTIDSSCCQMLETGGASLTVADNFELRGDAERLERLFENLLWNVIDHTRTDIIFWVETLDNRVGFYLKDNGPDIPEVARKQVFELGNKTRPSGIGFGLSIVAEVVQAHGWNIEAAKSKVGGGRFETIAVDIPE